MSSRSPSRFPPHAPRSLVGGASARSTSGRAGRDASMLTLSTGSARRRPSRFRGTQGVLSQRRDSVCRPSGSRGCRSPHEPRHPALRARHLASTVGSGTTGACVLYLQIFSDMQRELVLMTKPKHKNVLMVHGMYALGSSVGVRWSGPPVTAHACASACAAPRLKRTCCW